MSRHVDTEAIRHQVFMPGLLPAEAKRIKCGNNRFRAQCPIHGGERMSFAMMLGKDGWHFNCFACGAKGSVFDLLMALQGCSFKEAASQLSEGVASLPVWSPTMVHRAAFLLACDEAGCGAVREIEADEVAYVGRTVAVAWELHAKKWRCPLCSVRHARRAM